MILYEDERKKKSEYGNLSTNNILCYEQNFALWCMRMRVPIFSVVFVLFN